jgi:hypothetical protein
MKRYYLLRTSSDPKEIGVTNGIYQAEVCKTKFENRKLYDNIYNFLGSYDSWSRKGQVPDFPVELQYVKMLRRAMITDFMQYTPSLMDCPFLISEKVKAIWVNFNIQKYYLYKANVITNENDKLPFHLFYSPAQDYSVINFDKSTFYKGLPGLSKEAVTIKTSEEYINTDFVMFDHIILNKLFDASLDLFILSTDIFISERLYEAMHGVGVTGVNMFQGFGDVKTPPTVEIES